MHMYECIFFVFARTGHMLLMSPTPWHPRTHDIDAKFHALISDEKFLVNLIYLKVLNHCD